MSNVKTQTRGNCPCCGREQAVLSSGRMSKHGYTVEDGWFNGVCSGDRYAPMQIQREVTDSIVATVRADVAAMKVRAEDLATGRIKLGLIAKPGEYVRRGEKPTMIEWSTLPTYQAQDALRSAIWHIETHAKAGADFANFLEATVNTVHGQPLREVTLEAGPAPILSGEKRKSPSGRILIVRYTERGRVYWKTEDGYKSWTGSAAFRKYEVV
jgi:hypothetical protein